MRILRYTFVLIILALAAEGAFAQVPTGTPPFGTFASNSAQDVIDLANLNAHIPIPVLHKAGRGVDFTYDLSYDSSIWSPVTTSGVTAWQQVQSWGWRGQTEAATGYISYGSYLTGYSHCTIITYDNFVYHDAWGIPHPFLNATAEGMHDRSVTDTCGLCDDPPTQCFSGLTQTSSDNSGFTLYIPDSNSSDFLQTPVLYGRDGKTFNVPVNIGNGSGNFTDRNGNLISVNGSGQFFDTLSSTNAVLTVSGSGTPSSPMEFALHSSVWRAALLQIELHIQVIQVATNFGISGISEFGKTAINLVSSVVLPDGTQYTIAYEPTPSPPLSRRLHAPNRHLHNKLRDWKNCRDDATNRRIDFVFIRRRE